MIIKDYFSKGRDAIIEDWELRIIWLLESDLNEEDIKYIKRYNSTYSGYKSSRKEYFKQYYSKNQEYFREYYKDNKVKIKTDNLYRYYNKQWYC